MVKACVRNARPRPGTDDGFTYLGVLIVVALLGIGLLAASEVWVVSAHRQKVEEVEWIGAQFRQAIGSYYEASPGPLKTYPSNLQELIEDRRYVTVRRHLRTIYANPFSGKADWELVKAADGRVRGIRTTYVTQAGPRIVEFIYQPGSAT
jgi:type II secretory pathway pseudopilin PulG